MEKISPDLARVFIKRTVAALQKAKYHPAECQDLEVMAGEIFKPFIHERTHHEFVKKHAKG